MLVGVGQQQQDSINWLQSYRRSQVFKISDDGWTLMKIPLSSIANSILACFGNLIMPSQKQLYLSCAEDEKCEE